MRVEGKTKIIKLKVSVEEREYLDAQAKAANMETISDYLRSRCGLSTTEGAKYATKVSTRRPAGRGLTVRFRVDDVEIERLNTKAARAGSITIYLRKRLGLVPVHAAKSRARILWTLAPRSDGSGLYAMKPIRTWVTFAQLETVQGRK